MNEPLPGFGAFSLLFVVLSAIFLIFFLCAVGLIIFLWVKSYQAVKSQGVDPLSVPGQVVGRLAKSDLLASEGSVEARLQELDDLRARGVISDEEHRAARARVLAGS